MPAVFQRSFNGGIVSNELIPRQDVSKVAQGLKDCENFYLTVSGAAPNRPGTRYVATVKEQDNPERVVLRRFAFNDAQAYAIESGHRYLRLFQDAAPISLLAPESVTTRYYLGSADGLNVSGISSTLGELTLLSKPLQDNPYLFNLGGGGHIVFTTEAGVPGGVSDEFWQTGNHKLVLTIAGVNTINKAQSSGTITLLANLYRVNASGTAVNGAHAADEGTVVAVTMSGEIWTEGSTLEFNWTDLEWGGTFAAGDRLALHLQFAETTPATTTLNSYIQLDGAQSYLETSVSSDTFVSVKPWSPLETYEEGEVVAVFPYVTDAETWYVKPGDPSPHPTSIPAPFTTLSLLTPYGIVTQNADEAVGDLLTGGIGTDRSIIITTKGGVPGWDSDQWPNFEDLAALRLRFTLQTSIPVSASSDITFRFAWARFDSSNVYQEKGPNTQFTIVEDGTAVENEIEIYLAPPDAGWTSPGSTDRWGILLQGDKNGSSTPYSGTILSGTLVIDSVPVADTSGTPLLYVANSANSGVDPRTDTDGTWSAGLLGWASSDDYVPGDVVFTEASDEFSRFFALSAEDISPTPSGVSDVTDDDAYGTMNAETDPAVAGSLDIDVADTATEVQIFMTKAGEPGFTTWPEDDTTVSLEFSAVGGTSTACDVTVTLVKFEADGALASQTFVASSAIDVANVGTGTHVFTCPPPSDGWGTIAATDRLGIVITYDNNQGGSGNFTATLDLGVATSFVQTPYLQAESGYDYFYCVATHSDKDPREVRYQDDFWYVLEKTSDGLPILEIPVIFDSTDLREFEWVQSRDTITITHEDYPPHEFVRSVSDAGITRFTCLPIGFKPRTSPPTNITITTGVTGTSGSPGKTIRYKVTAIDEDSGTESGPGGGANTAAGGASPSSVGDTDATISDATAQSTTLDLAVTSTSHGLVTGNQIIVTLVETQDPERANEHARIALLNAVFTITKTSDDAFTLDNTAGLLTVPAITALETEGFPSIQIDWQPAYAELTAVKVPKGSGGTRIEFSWTAVAGAREYFVYRQIEGEEDWGFLGSTNELSFVDEGDPETNGVKAVVDTDSGPPEYRNPFTYGNWPRASAYHAQRQWFGGTNNDPLRGRASVVGDFRNFGTRFPITASDAIDFTIAGEEANQIQSMRSLGAFVILTSGAVWNLPSDVAGVIDATQPLGFELFSHEGAARTRPLAVDDALIYPQSRGSILRAFRININTGGPGGYEGDNLSLYSPELFDGFQVLDLARSAIPDPIVWSVRSDGILLGMTYEPRHNVWGWHRHTTRSDLWQSVTTIPENAVDALYSICARSINGSTAYYIEKMLERTVGRAGTDDRSTIYFVDCGLTFDGTNTTDITLTLTGGSTWEEGETGLTLTASEDLFPVDGSSVDNGYRLVGADGEEVEVVITAETSTTVCTVTLLTDAPASTQATATSSWVAMVDSVSGLDHLEGETVAILADANVLDQDTVSSGAVSAFDRPYGIIHVGLPIAGQGEILDIDEGGDSIVAMVQKRTPRATVYVEDTRGLQLSTGDDGAVAYPLPTERGDTETGLITDKRVVRLASNWNRHGRVKWIQTDPLPAKINALLVEYEVGGP